MVKPDDCVSTDFRAWFLLYHHHNVPSGKFIDRLTPPLHKPTGETKKTPRGPAPSERRLGCAPTRWPLSSRSPTGKIAGCPSWTRIEPCVSLRTRNFDSCSSKRETSRSRPNSIQILSAARAATQSPPGVHFGPPGPRVAHRADAL